MKDPSLTEAKTTENETSPSKNEVMSLLAQGKRHLFVKDYPAAVTALGEACGKLSEEYGELADELADAYFSYGQALLELSREESGVLAENELPGEDNEEGDDGQDEESNDEENDNANDVEETTESKTNGDEKQGDEDDKGDDEKTDEKEGDVNNLQLAWEVLELAKVIFHRQNNELKLAETYLYLGEINIESENYSMAIDDMKKCLDIRKAVLPEDHRDIAEILFQLGVASSHAELFLESKEYYKSALDVLQTRINNLQSGCVTNNTNGNPFYSVEKEIDEIKELLPEIKERIEDLDNTITQAKKSVLELMSTAASSVGPSTQNGNADKPVSNISHLVKKKRKPDDDPAPEDPKKLCTKDK